MQEMWVQSLGQEDPLEEGMATHSSIYGWEIPRTEKPGRLQSMGSQRVGQDLANKHSHSDCVWPTRQIHPQRAVSSGPSPIILWSVLFLELCAICVQWGGYRSGGVVKITHSVCQWGQTGPEVPGHRSQQPVAQAVYPGLHTWSMPFPPLHSVTCSSSQKFISKWNFYYCCF